MDQNNPYVQPGIDNASHLEPMHQNIAQAISDATGKPVDSSKLMPAIHQNPVSALDEKIVSKAYTEVEPAQVVNIVDNKLGSFNFLKLFLERLKKQHPEGVIKKD